MASFQVQPMQFEGLVQAPMADLPETVLPAVLSYAAAHASGEKAGSANPCCAAGQKQGGVFSEEFLKGGHQKVNQI